MKKRNRALLLFITLSVMIFSGCASENDRGQAQDSSVAEEENATQNTEEDMDASAEKETENSAEEETQTAPAIVFEAQDMEGNTVSSDILANSKLTMINVWATYCNPCLSEMPELGELAGEYDPADFQLIGIISDVQEGGDEAQIALAASLIEQTGADYTHLLLNRSLYSSLLTGVNAVPTTFFLDENGTILGTVIGAKDKSAWEEIINGLLEN